MTKKLTINFPTAIRRSMATVTPRTIVQLGKLQIVFHGNTPIYARYGEETISCLSYVIKKETDRYIPGKMESVEMPYNQFLFRLNRMLAEQGHSVIDPILDGALTKGRTLE